MSHTVALLTNNLRAELIARKISPADFARLMGVSQTWVGRLLAGKTTPGPALEARINAFLRVCWVCGKRWTGHRGR